MSSEILESTRVFVSGLPPHLTSEQLATHFKSHSKVNDAHVLGDRRIGFVGFTTSTDAKDAVKHFNRSYIRMSKITVDLAKPIEVKHDQHGHSIPVSKRNAQRTNSYSEERAQKRKRVQEDDGENLREAKVETAKTNFHTDHSKPQGADTLISRAAEQNQNDEALEQEAESHNPADDDWLRGKTSRLLDLVDPGDHKENVTDPIAYLKDVDVVGTRVDNAQSDSREIDNASRVTQPTRQSVPNARLFVRNLPFSITTEDIRTRFAEFGRVQEAHIVKDYKTDLSKGMAFVQYAEPENAENAIQALDGAAFHGRLLHILPASDKREQGLTDFDISKLPLKQQKALKRKKDAGAASFSWNSLYMNPDAVVSSIADRLGVTKAEILDPTSSDAAIKQAHAETHIIRETKDYLGKNGINIEAFKNRDRDEKTLLLKNFPYGTLENELRNLLEPFGTVKQLVFPPSGTMAIARYEEKYQAQQALKGLAYKNIKGTLLYLEKAPKGLFEKSDTTNSTDQIEDSAVSLAESIVPIGDVATLTTAFIRNLNFATTTERLKEVFGVLSGFVSARVKTRTDTRRPGEILSMGFGFVDFRTKEQAEAAVAAMNGRHLDGHELSVQLSHKTNDLAEERYLKDRAKAAELKHAKIIIKNLPFQASKKDVRSLFSQYGLLKKVRVPRKLDNSTRGFAFAEFITPKEAQTAMEALTDTHLLGRRLVLEFAQSDDVDPEKEIEAIEKKIEQQSNRVQHSKLAGPGRRKFNVDTGREDLAV